jgi:hypothetical protein
VKGAHEIDLGQWPCGMVVITDKRTYNRYIRMMCGKHAVKSPPFPETNCGNCQTLEQPGACFIVISIGKTPDDAERILTLVHEATHAMRYILEHALEKNPGTETEAYLVEHIVRQGMKALSAGS